MRRTAGPGPDRKQAGSPRQPAQPPDSQSGIQATASRPGLLLVWPGPAAIEQEARTWTCTTKPRRGSCGACAGVQAPHAAAESRFPPHGQGQGGPGTCRKRANGKPGRCTHVGMWPCAKVLFISPHRHCTRPVFIHFPFVRSTSTNIRAGQPRSLAALPSTGAHARGAYVGACMHAARAHVRSARMQRAPWCLGTCA